MPAPVPTCEHELTERVRVSTLGQVSAVEDVPVLQVVEMSGGALALLSIEGTRAEVVGPKTTREEAYRTACVILEGLVKPDALFRLALAVVALTKDVQQRDAEIAP